MARRRRFGRVRRLPSGRYQVRYLAPDGVDRSGPHTFERKADADRWLAAMESDLLRGDWTDPESAQVRLDAYAASWIRERPGLRPKTVQLYEGLLRLHIAPGLGRLSVGDLTPAQVRSWRADLLGAGLGAVTVAKAYRLLRAVLATAEADRLVRRNPCQISGASAERSPERPILTVQQVYAMADAMPGRLRLLVLLATFGSLRWGEEHLRDHVGVDAEARIFTGPKGAPLRRSNFQKHWRSALAGAGVTEVHFHDLRHTGNTLTAHAGATLSDLMSRMGHSSTRAASIYLHTTSQRDRAVADSLNVLLAQARNGHVAGTAAQPKAATETET